MTTSFGDPSAIAAPKKKHSFLPLLVGVFLLSYGLMTMLIVEQGAAIQSQGNLIKVLLPDSRELWGLKGKAIGDQQASRTQKQGHAGAPSKQTPANRAPATQPPSTQAAPQSNSQNRAGKTAKPQHPPVPASDLLDQRRALHTI